MKIFFKMLLNTDLSMSVSVFVFRHFKPLIYVSSFPAFRDLYSAELVKMSPTGFPISVSISISTFGWVSLGVGALSIGMISDLLITTLNCCLHWRCAKQGKSLDTRCTSSCHFYLGTEVLIQPLGNLGERKCF